MPTTVKYQHRCDPRVLRLERLLEELRVSIKIRDDHIEFLREKIQNLEWQISVLTSDDNLEEVVKRLLEENIHLRNEVKKAELRNPYSVLFDES